MFENRLSKQQWTIKYTALRIFARGFILSLFWILGILFMLGLSMIASIPILCLERKCYHRTYVSKDTKYKFITPVNIIIVSIIFLNLFLTQLFVSLYHHEIIFHGDYNQGFAYYVIGLLYLPILKFNGGYYPMLPWFNFVLIGILLGRYMKIKKRLHELDQAYKTMLYHAVAYFVVFVLIRSIGSNDFGNFNSENWYDFKWLAFNYMVLTKYPPSLTFSLLAISQCFIILDLIRAFEVRFCNDEDNENRNKCVRFMKLVYDIALTFGRAPFVVYICHAVFLYALYFVLTLFDDLDYYAWYSNVLIIVVAVIMYCMFYPVARKYQQFKFKKDATSWWKLC